MSKWKGSYDSSRMYNASWEREYPWITKARDGTEYALCKLCMKTLQPRKTTITSHAKTREHRIRESSARSLRPDLYPKKMLNNMITGYRTKFTIGSAKTEHIEHVEAVLEEPVEIKTDTPIKKQPSHITNGDNDDIPMSSTLDGLIEIDDHMDVPIEISNATDALKNKLIWATEALNESTNMQEIKDLIVIITQAGNGMLTLKKFSYNT